MATIFFIPRIGPCAQCSRTQSGGGTVREVLDGVFAANPEVREYLLDEQSTLRKHIVVFVDGEMLSDRACLSDAVNESSAIHVLQAMSGG